MPNPLRQLLKRSPFYARWKELGWYPDYLYWRLRGRPPRTPHLQKQRTVTGHAARYGLTTLVETGTYYGEMVSAQRRRFREIHTVEFSPALARRAQQRFARWPHIHVYEGDSKVIVPKILSGLREPALFWLDAGYYGWAGDRSDDTRLASEFEAILRHLPGHVILMDDADGLDGLDGRLSVPALTEYVQRQFPGRHVEVQWNILRVTPSSR